MVSACVNGTSRDATLRGLAYSFLHELAMKYYELLGNSIVALIVSRIKVETDVSLRSGQIMPYGFCIRDVACVQIQFTVPPVLCYRNAAMAVGVG